MLSACWFLIQIKNDNDNEYVVSVISHDVRSANYLYNTLESYFVCCLVCCFCCFCCFCCLLTLHAVEIPHTTSHFSVFLYYLGGVKQFGWVYIVNQKQLKVYQSIRRLPTNYRSEKNYLTIGQRCINLKNQIVKSLCPLTPSSCGTKLDLCNAPSPILRLLLH